MAAAWSMERVGVRLGPSIHLYGMGDRDPLATFGHVVRELDARDVGYLAMLEPNAKDRAKGVGIEQVAATFRPMTRVPFIANAGFDRPSGTAARPWEATVRARPPPSGGSAPLSPSRARSDESARR